MAKITTTDVTQLTRLSSRGDNLYQRQGSVVRRRLHKTPHYYRPAPTKKHFHRTSLRKKIHEFAQAISEHWSQLSQDQRDAWGTYATYFPGIKNGYQAFFQNNLRLKRTGLESLGWVDDITVPPDTIQPPTGLCVQFLTINAGYCATWTDPLCNSLWVQCFKWVPPGLMRGRDWRYKYITTVNSTLGELFAPVVFDDTGRISLLTFRVINARGEISDWYDPIKSSKLAQQRSAYGSVYYGYAYYGDE